MRVSSFYLQPFFRGFVFAIGMVLSETISPAQLFDAPGPGGSATFSGNEATVIRGRVDLGHATSERLSVVLTRPGNGGTIASADVLSTGEFELALREPPKSLYELYVVEMTQNRVIYREHVSWSPGQAWLEIVIPKQKTSEPVSGWVTVNQLRQKPPKKALKEFARSQKAMAGRDYQQSAAHLEKAVAIYPSYVDAHQQLGMAYLKQENFVQASQSFGRASELDPYRADSRYCLGLALAAMQRFEEAEAAAREAVRLSPGLPWAHYVLGLVLVKRNTDMTEAVVQLRQAAPAVPLARIGLAHLLAYQGKPQEAAVELKSYLDSGAKDNRQWAEAWMKKLRGE
jgi:tetratricopeptide (TPR) repeat protein